MTSFPIGVEVMEFEVTALILLSAIIMAAVRTSEIGDPIA
jgi:hypothetical protein